MEAKTIHSLLKAILLAAFLSIACSCSKDTKEIYTDGSSRRESDVTPVTPTTKTPLTLLVYGVGGGDLDGEFDEVVIKCVETLKEKGLLANKVNIAIQTKYSAMGEKWKGILGDCSTVYRYVVDPNTSYIETDKHLPDSYKLAGGDSTFNMSTSEALADFLKWAAQNAPADRYILITEDHGKGYRPYDDISDMTTKCCLYDDQLSFDVATVNGVPIKNKYNLTVKAMAQGIRDSGVDINTIFFNLCINNNIEVISELAQSAEYIFAAPHAISTVNGAYSQLVDYVLNNDDYEEALREFASFMSANQPEMDTERKGMPQVNGFCVTRTSQIPAVLSAVKKMADILYGKQTLLTSLEKSGDTEGADTLKASLSKAINSCYRYEDITPDPNYPYFDIGDFLAKLAREFYYDKEIRDCLNEFNAARDNAIAAFEGNFYLWDGSVKDPSWSVNIVKNGTWLYSPSEDDKENKNEETNEAKVQKDTNYYALHYNGDVSYRGKTDVVGSWFSTIPQTYGRLAFDKATGWSKWLEINQFEPTGNPSMAAVKPEKTKEGE